MVTVAAEKPLSEYVTVMGVLAVAVVPVCTETLVPFCWLVPLVGAGVALLVEAGVVSVLCCLVCVEVLGTEAGAELGVVP